MQQRTPGKPVSEPNSAALRRTLAAAGWRFTRQRAAVFEYLCSTKDHATAEQVYEAVRRHLPNISLATVYKALEALVDARLANKLPDASGPARYDCRNEAHYHFRCLKTGSFAICPRLLIATFSISWILIWLSLCAGRGSM